MLFVDLDRTIFAGDCLLESLLRAFKRNPFISILAALWLLRGKAYLKSRLAALSPVDAEYLPYRPGVLDFLRDEKRKGRCLVLATASNEKYAREISQHLGLFDDVLASDHIRNLKGAAKKLAIEDYCRHRRLSGYGYVGDSLADLPIWEGAQEVVVVAPRWPLARSIRHMNRQFKIIDSQTSRSQIVFRAIRPRHWAKNFLLFVPLLVGHQLGSASKLQAAAIAFVAFCACASAVYLLNDLFDIDSDRRHPVKKHRPLASGALSPLHAVGIGLALLSFSLGLSTLLLPASFVGSLIGYFALSVVYTLVLKRHLAIDVIALSALYLIRLFAGGFAAGISISYWLLMFALFICTSVALAKRYAELLTHADDSGPVPGRGYKLGDTNVIRNFGPASGVISVLVLALYIDSEQVKAVYVNPDLLWLICPLLLYWVLRLWIAADRQQAEDPVLFMLGDVPSLLVIGSAALLVALA